MEKRFEDTRIFSFKTLNILKDKEEIKIVLREIKNKEVFFARINSLYRTSYFGSKNFEIKKPSALFNKECFQNEVLNIFNLSNLKEFSNIGYAFGEKNYPFLFKPLLYEKKYLSSSKNNKLNCAFIDDDNGFEDHIKLGYCISNHLFCKEVFSDINHVERIKFIALILQCAGFLFEVITLDDFILNQILGLCLSRYRHIKQFDENVTNILRCPKCHTSMELDLKIFREKVLRKQEAHYSCPNCKTSSSYTKLLKTYETNIRNSYKQGGLL